MDIDSFNDGLMAFLNRATSPFHAVREMVTLLEGAGFSALTDGEDWNLEPGKGYYLTRNDSSLVAFRIGDEAGPEQGIRMVGAHTDSPCLMVKPNPEKDSYFFYI